MLSDNANPATQSIALNGVATESVGSFKITGLVNTTAGTVEVVTVTAYDIEGHVYRSYNNPYITASVPNGTDGAYQPLQNGTAIFPIQKFIAGSYTLKVEDFLPSISASSSFSVSAGHHPLSCPRRS